MIAALVVDLDGLRELPADTLVMGRALAAYPLMAAQACKRIKRIYLVSDAPPVKAVALQYEAIIIDPPPGESHPEPVGRAAHGWRFMKEDLKSEEPLELAALLFTHAAAVTAETLDLGLDIMLADPKLDAAATVTRSEFCHPRFAFWEAAENRLEPLLSSAPWPREARSPEGGRSPLPEGAWPQEAWFPDLAGAILRPRCLDALRVDLAPTRPAAGYPWLGTRVWPLKREGTSPVDHGWQVPQLEHWLKENGVVDISTVMEPQPKPQPMPRQDRR
ncbi:MAG: hypothetical protein HY748_07880 [Elusimicrobia bacterium]|nr:hypothetical protein [Elusimicrobiota bacterium]